MKERGFAAMAACLTLAGCAHLVGSQSVASEDKSAPQGLTYYLPKQLLKVEFARAPAPDQDAVKKAQDAADKSKSAAADAKDKVDALTKELALLKNEKAKEKTAAALDKAKATQTTSQNAADKDAATLKDLLLKRYDALGSESGFVDSLTITALAPVADTKNKYVATLDHWMSRSDNLTLKTDSSGLLNNVEGTGEDQTGQIIVSLVEAIVALPGASHVPLTELTTKVAAPLLTKYKCAQSDSPTLRGKPVSFTASYVFDPTQEAFNEVAEALCRRGADYKFVWKMPDLAEKADTHVAAPVGHSLYYRRTLPYSLKIFSTDNRVQLVQDPDILQQSMVLNLPNGAPVEQLDLPTGWFVKTEYTLGFENGMLLSQKVSRPSELAAAAHLPLDIAMGIIEIPAKIISLKVDYTKQEVGLSSAQTDLIKQQQALKQAQKDAAGSTTTPTP